MKTTEILTVYSFTFQQLVNLFARLATDNIGYIDWDPYVPKVIREVFFYLLIPSARLVFFYYYYYFFTISIIHMWNLKLVELIRVS